MNTLNEHTEAVRVVLAEGGITAAPQIKTLCYCLSCSSGRVVLNATSQTTGLTRNPHRLPTTFAPHRRMKGSTERLESYCQLCSLGFLLRFPQTLDNGRNGNTLRLEAGPGRNASLR